MAGHDRQRDDGFEAYGEPRPSPKARSPLVQGLCHETRHASSSINPRGSGCDRSSTTMGSGPKPRSRGPRGYHACRWVSAGDSVRRLAGTQVSRGRGAEGERHARSGRTAGPRLRQHRRAG
jgi:hypothetical protein